MLCLTVMISLSDGHRTQNGACSDEGTIVRVMAMNAHVKCCQLSSIVALSLVVLRAPKLSRIYANVSSIAFQIIQTSTCNV